MNLQQCPSKLGDIRTMFKAGDGCVFVNCDFSKQEPCVLASASQDPKLIEVFHSGLDIYGKMASMMYDMPYEECLEFYPDGTTNHEGKNRRSSAKKTTLAIMYSKGVKSLSEDIHCTVEKAQEIYDSVLTAYPVMANWMEQTIKNAYATGMIDNIYGRRRRLPNLLLPKFDIDVPSDEAHVVDFYKKFYTNKLNKVWKDSDVNKIKDEAREYGILITDNRKEIAESYRKIINFCIQGCIVGDSLITTQEYGLTKISDVVYEDVHVWDGESFVKASCLPSGKKELMRIMFYDGRTIDCSPTHKFLFKNVAGKESWKTAKELYDMGDKQVRMITISNEVDDFDVISDTDFPELDKTNIHNAHSYNFNCIKDSYELGYVLGWLHCDGSVIKDRNCYWLFAENKLNILSTVESILSKYFNYTVSTESVEQIKQQKKGMNVTQSLTRLIIYSKTLANQALAMGIKHHIPNVIFKSKRAMLGFIQACFDSDGSISAGHGPFFTLGKGCYYERFAKEFQQILSLFGFASRLNYCSDKINVVILKRDAKKFESIIGFRHTNKSKILSTVEKTLKHNEYLNTTRIKTVEYLGEEVDMFDIVNSESHKFVVNGVVTHNSAAVITKRAMRNIYNNKRLRELGVKLVLSVHDESMCIVPKEHAYEACQIIEQCSIDAGKGLPVSLSCDLAITENWHGQEFTFDENHKLIPKSNHF